jgi:conjugal transfer/entry exclusion protein
MVPKIHSKLPLQPAESKAQGRAQSLEAAQRTLAQDQGREQLRRFLTPGVGYQPTSVQMFH